jgi:signal transduction histidine kinase
MLHEFLSEHRDAILARCRELLDARKAPTPTAEEKTHGIALFLDQLNETLRLGLDSNPEIGAAAARYGGELMRGGFSVSQVVHDYGDLCQSITQLAGELEAPITVLEFRSLNRCLDDAIAVAVTEHGRQRDQMVARDGALRLNERIGLLAHELRNELTKALLSFDVINSGNVGAGGSTAAALGHSLRGLFALIDRELTDVRLSAGMQLRKRVLVAQVVEDVEVHASVEAKALGVELSVRCTDRSLAVDADRQILASVLTHLLHNACKFTRPHGGVLLEVRATAERVLIDVTDECGGLPPGKVEELARPFADGGGLGLAISRRGAAAHGGSIEVRNLAGIGCIFTVVLTRSPVGDAARPPAPALRGVTGR